MWLPFVRVRVRVPQFRTCSQAQAQANLIKYARPQTSPAPSPTLSPSLTPHSRTASNSKQKCKHDLTQLSIIASVSTSAFVSMIATKAEI